MGVEFRSLKPVSAVFLGALLAGALAFDGKTLKGFYTTLGDKAPNNDPVGNPDGTFSVRAGDSSLHATGSPTGHIYTKKLYSHYRVRIREKFDRVGDLNQNAGMLYHVRIEGPRLFGAYPRSIEYQGRKRGMGEIWITGNVYVITTVDSSKEKHQFKSGGKLVSHGNPDGGWAIRYDFSGSGLDLGGDAGSAPGGARSLSIRTLDGRILDRLELSGNKGLIHWRGARSANGGPLVLRESRTGLTSLANF